MKAAPANNLPRHIAIIMDGNGRWAKQRGLSRLQGHKAGLDAVERVIGECSRLGIEFLTLYTFSAENWQRPKTEVSALMRLLETALTKKGGVLQRNNARLIISGRRIPVPVKTLSALDNAVIEYSVNTGLTVNLAFNYGGRQEIVDAVNKAISKGAQTIDENLISANLYAPDIPAPDIIIRTSGEYRISNFLLWQSAYSEFYFMPKFWPDFSAEDLTVAIDDYFRRDRRFGGV